MRNRHRGVLPQGTEATLIFPQRGLCALALSNVNRGGDDASVIEREHGNEEITVTDPIFVTDRLTGFDGPSRKRGHLRCPCAQHLDGGAEEGLAAMTEKA